MFECYRRAVRSARHSQQANTGLLCFWRCRAQNLDLGGKAPVGRNIELIQQQNSSSYFDPSIIPSSIELRQCRSLRLSRSGQAVSRREGKGEKCVENSTLETFERGLQKIIPKGQTAWDNNGLCHGHWQAQPGDLGWEGDVSQLVS